MIKDTEEDINQTLWAISVRLDEIAEAFKKKYSTDGKEDKDKTSKDAKTLSSGTVLSSSDGLVTQATAVKELLNVMKSFGKKGAEDVKKISHEIVDLFKSLNSLEISGAKTEGFVYIAKFFEAIGSMTIGNVMAFKLLTNILSADAGKKMAAFFKNFLGINMSVDLKGLGLMVTGIGDLIKAMVASLIGVALLIKFIDLATVEKAALMVVGIFVEVALALKFLLKSSSKDGGTVVLLKGAGEAISGIGKLMILMTVSLIGIALVMKYIQGDTLQTGVGIMIAIYASIIIGLKFLSSKRSTITAAAETLNALNRLIVTMALLIVGLTIFYSKFGPSIVSSIEAFITTFLSLIAGIVIISKLAKNNLKDSAEGVKAISETIFILIIDIGLLIFMTSMAKRVEWGTITLIGVAIIAILALMTVMSNYMKKNGEEIQEAAIGISVLIASFSVSMLLLAFIAHKDSGAMWQGFFLISMFMVVMLGFMLGLSFISGLCNVTKWFAPPGKAEGPSGLMMEISMVFAIVSAVSFLFLIPIGRNFGDALLGLLIIAAILTGMTFMMMYMIKFVKDKDNTPDKIDAASKMLLLLSVTFAIVAAVTALFIIPIGKNWQSSLLGLIAVTAILAELFGLGYAIVHWAKQIDSLDDKASFKAAQNMFLELAGIFALLAVITYEYIIPIGRSFESSWKGLIAVSIELALIAGIGIAIVKYAKTLNKTKINKIKEVEILLGVIAGVIALMAFITKTYILPIGQQIAKTPELLGWIVAINALILGMLAGGVAIAKFASKIPAQADIYKGMALIGAVAAVIFVLSYTIDKYIDLINKLKNTSWADLENGSGKILALIAAFGAVMIGLGFAAPWIAGPLFVGGLLLAGIAAVITVVAYIVNSYVDLIQKAKNVTAGDITQFNKTLIGDGTDNTPSILGSIKKIIDGFNELGFFASGKAMLIAEHLRPVFDVISEFVDIVIKIATMHYIDHYDDKGHPVYETIAPSVFGDAAKFLINGFRDFILQLGVAFAGFGHVHYKDADGNLHDAAPGDAFDAMSKMADVIGPIMSAVSDFVDAVIKVATMTFITGYDANGKPQYEKVDPSVFGAAAAVVSAGFGQFINTLNASFAAMSNNAITVMDKMKEVLKPIMDAFASFIDSIIKVSTARIQTGTDSKGNPITEEITGAKIQVNSNGTITVGGTVSGYAAIAVAGQAVATIFSSFLISIGTGLSGCASTIETVFDALGENIQNVMSGLSTFIDAILKVATAQMLDHYDDKGHPVYKTIVGQTIDFDSDTGKVTTGGQVTGYEAIANAGKVVAGVFIFFLKRIGSELKDTSGDINTVLNDIGENLTNVMTAVSKFMDTIIKVASAQIVVGYDEKGHPKMGPIKGSNVSVNWKTGDIHVLPGQATGYAAIGAAGMVVGAVFISFLRKIGNVLHENADVIGETLETLNKNLNPVMNGIGKFVDIIVKLATLTITTTDENGKQKVTKVSQKDIFDAAYTVAVSFVNFLHHLIGQLNTAEVRSAVQDVLQVLSQNIGKVMDGLDKFMTPILSLASGTITITDADGNQTTQQINLKAIPQLGTDLATCMTNFMKEIAAGYNDNAADINGLFGQMNNYTLFYNAAAKWATQITAINDEIGKAKNLKANVDMFVKCVEEIAMYDEKTKTFKVYKILSEESTSKYTNYLNATTVWAGYLKNIADTMGNHTHNLDSVIGTFINALNKFMNLQMPQNAQSTVAAFNSIIKGSYALIKTFDYLRNHALWLERQLIGLYNTLVKLDNYNQSQEKKREETLVKLAQNVNNLGAALENVNKQIAALDESKLQALGLSASQGAYSAVVTTKQGSTIEITPAQSSSSAPSKPGQTAAQQTQAQHSNREQSISLGETAIINLLRQVIQELNLSHTKTYNLQLTQGYGLNDYKVSVF